MDPMRKSRLPKVFNMAIEPKVIIEDYSVLRAFASKKVPLWIMSKSIEQKNDKDIYPCLFKNGDDMRQDILTMQLF
jgi:hypothetical protein